MSPEELAEFQRLLLEAETAAKRYSAFMGADARRKVVRVLALARKLVQSFAARGSS